MIVGAEPIILKQHVPQIRDEATGAAIVGVTTDTIVSASVQPMNGQDRQTLPEGQRRKDGWKLYTACAMKPANQYTQTNGDLVVIDSIEYQVMVSKPMRKVIKHFKVLVTRTQEVDPNA